MRSILLLVVILSISAGIVTCCLVFRRLFGPTKEQIERRNDWNAFQKAKYESCDIKRRTAASEESVYGAIISGSVLNHVSGCSYCRYVRSGDAKILSEHINEMKILEEEWMHGRRASYPT